MNCRLAFNRVAKVVTKQIFCHEYLQKGRVNDRCFVRDRKMSFTDSIMFILSGRKCSLQTKLNKFFKEMGRPKMEYSAQAFSKRRQQIRPEAILDLVQLTGASFYEAAKAKKWHKYRLFAVDGTKCNVPEHPKSVKYFGVQKSQGEDQPQALCSCLYDVLNNIIIDASINPCDANERNLAEKHLEYLDSKDFENDYIILFDRGYPSAKLISELERRGIRYVMRFSSTFLKVDEDIEDQVVTHHFKNESNEAIHTFRILNFSLESGEREMLVTNLFDESLTKNDFKELYHYRWGIETAYKELKGTLEIENFTGKLPIAVMQDFYATLFLYNLISTYEYDLEPKFNERQEKSNSMNKRKINRKRLADELVPEVVKMVYSAGTSFATKRFKYIENRIFQSPTTIRPNRHYDRNVKHKSSKYPSNRKNTSGLS